MTNVDMLLAIFKSEVMGKKLKPNEIDREIDIALLNLHHRILAVCCNSRLAHFWCLILHP